MPDPLWQDNANRRFTSFVVNDETILAGGHPDLQEDAPFLVAIDAFKRHRSMDRATAVDSSQRWC